MKRPDTFPSLDITFNANGLVLLEQDDGCGNVEHVALHPAHVQHIAERLGLTDKGVLGARAQAATLRRRLETLKGRIDHLDDMLSHCGEREDLEPEKDYSFASWEIATEFCKDFDEAFDIAFPKALPEGSAERAETLAETQPATAPVTPATVDARQLDLVGVQ